jgi:hypothetical protein
MNTKEVPVSEFESDLKGWTKFDTTTEQTEAERIMILYEEFLEYREMWNADKVALAKSSLRASAAYARWMAAAAKTGGSK